MDKNLLEITGYDGEGYVPLIDYSHWRVAELRYCEELEVDKLKDMQKHDETDEVFVLLEGDFTLFLGGNGEHISVQICLIGRFLNCVIWIRKNVIRPSASVVP